MCGGISLIGDLSKMDVYRLARHVNQRHGAEKIPEETFRITPSAELAEGQYDPFDYSVVSPVVGEIVEHQAGPEDLVKLFERQALDPIRFAPDSEGRTIYDKHTVESFRALVHNAARSMRRAVYKRLQGPPIVVVSERAFGFDLRETIINKWEGEMIWGTAADPRCYNKSVSTRWAWTMSSHGDHAKIVNRPSCDATRATALRWSWTNCAADRWRVPPSCGRMDDRRLRPLDRLGDGDLLHRRRSSPPRDLRAEGQQLVVVGQQRGAVDRRQPGDRLDVAVQRVLPRRARCRVDVLPHQLRQPGKRRRHARRESACTIESRQAAVPAGTTSSSAAAAVRAHRDGELHQHVDRIAPRRRRVEAEQRRQQRRAVGKARRVLVDELDLIAFEHGDVDELVRRRRGAA